MNISILGCGSFGGAIESRLLLKGHTIVKEDVAQDSEIVLVAVPSNVVASVLLSFKDKLTNKKIIICSKGFDESGSLISSILDRELPNNQIFFICGPTLADELKEGLFSAVVLAGGEGKEEIKRQFESDNFKIILSDDVIGVQVASALKNTVGILLGIIEGAKLGQNTEGFIFSRGLEEIEKIGVYLGGDKNTFIGIAGAGDLFVRSRSRNIGFQVGEGANIEEVIKETIFPKEGLLSLKGLLKMENKLGIDISFFKIINDVLYNDLQVKDAVKKIADSI